VLIHGPFSVSDAFFAFFGHLNEPPAELVGPSGKLATLFGLLAVKSSCLGHVLSNAPDCLAIPRLDLGCGASDCAVLTEPR
jgi:hypothetical protein